MKQKLFLLIAAGVFMTACNNEPKTTATDAQVTTTNTSADTATMGNATTTNETSECYANTKSKDTVLLHLTINNNTVIGDMNYGIAGKDKNKGTLQGQLRGDTIFADYTFWSEGKQSVRQVAYLKKDNNLLEGYGDAEEQGDKMVFKNTNALNFGKGVVLQKVNCP